MKKYYALLLLLVLIKPTYSQIITAADFLNEQQSPLLIGAGNIGAAIPMKDASGFYYNPAQLGYFSHENNLSIFFMSPSTYWSNSSIPRNPFQFFSISTGYNFKKDTNDLPLSIGIGYTKNKFNYSIDVFGGEPTSNSIDCLSIGACYDNIFLYNLGFSIKSYYSNLAYYYPTHEESGTAFDFGLMIIAPLSKLFFNDFRLPIYKNDILKPKVDFTIGYSLDNAGKKIYYYGGGWKDPIPLTARLGYTFDFGIELNSKTTKIDAIDYSFTVEAENLLVKMDTLYNRDYRYSLGNFNIVKNLIELQGNQSVIVHRGHIFKLFETVIIMSGRFEGQGFNVSATNGFGISSEGIFKLLSSSTNNPVFRYITDHFVLEYYNSNTYYDDSIYKANYQGITINFRGIEL